MPHSSGESHSGPQIRGYHMEKGVRETKRKVKPDPNDRDAGPPSSSSNARGWNAGYDLWKAVIFRL